MLKDVGPSDLFSLKERKDNFLSLSGTVGAAHSWGCSNLLALMAQAFLFFLGLCSDFDQTFAFLLKNGSHVVLRQS